MGEISIKNDTLHIELICLLPGGRKKIIPYHILPAEKLPIFDQTAEIITVATSPEFYPSEADCLISMVGKYLEVDPKILANLLTQHSEMPSRFDK
ncbi:hypothetical protein N752_27705 [Desulforamulus aquiferis]|nr:hypothetical protein [Desulforamulus aquiferis]RYD01914.1 hypothetical protein N752_27705 [Desulforamulus aquiferis]